jgi:hypothetical protein
MIIEIGISIFTLILYIYFTYFLRKSLIKIEKATYEVVVKTIPKETNIIKQRYSMGFFITSTLFITCYHCLEDMFNVENLYVEITFNNSQIRYVNSNYKLGILRSELKYYLALFPVSLEVCSILNIHEINKDILNNIVIIQECSEFYNINLENCEIVFKDITCDLILLQCKNQNSEYIDINRERKFNSPIYTLGPRNCINFGHILGKTNINLDEISIEAISSSIKAPVGFSGGPLMMYDTLVGINFCTEEDDTIAYAIPNNRIKRFLEEYCNK